MALLSTMENNREANTGKRITINTVLLWSDSIKSLNAIDKILLILFINIPLSRIIRNYKK
jgi:hypothetical protein